MRPIWKIGLLTLGTIGSILGLDLLRGALVNHTYRVRETMEVYPLPPPEYVGRLAAGYNEAAASILWARSLYEYGEHVGQNRRFAFATQYLQTVAALDPKMSATYRFASTLVTMQSVNPTREELERTRVLLKSGCEELPDSADTWGAYATFMMFEGAQFLDKKSKIEWRAEGALAAQRAVELGYFRSSLGEVGAKFLEEAGHLELAVEQLERAYAVAPNDEARKEIERRLNKFRERAFNDRVIRAHRDFLTSWRAIAPYVEEPLFRLIRPRFDSNTCVGRVGVDGECKY